MTDTNSPTDRELRNWIAGISSPDNRDALQVAAHLGVFDRNAHPWIVTDLANYGARERHFVTVARGAQGWWVELPEPLRGRIFALFQQPSPA